MSVHVCVRAMKEIEYYVVLTPWTFIRLHTNFEILDCLFYTQCLTGVGWYWLA